MIETVAGDPGGGSFLGGDMRAFADFLETTAAAASTDAARNLTSLASVKTALKIADTSSDTLITSLIPRVSQLVANYCNLAEDRAGAVRTFGLETLRATWLVDAERYSHQHTRRGRELHLPWRLPLASIDAVTESGTTLAAGTDFQLVSARPGRLMRVSCDTPIDWSPGKIVVTFKAGFSSTLSDNVDKALEAAAIEQVKYQLFGAGRDPAIRLENVYDVARIDYSVPGGDVMGADVLLPAVRDMLSPWRNGGSL